MRINCIFIRYFWHWTRPNPTHPRRRILWPDPTRPNPTNGWTRPTSNCVIHIVRNNLWSSRGTISHGTWSCRRIRRETTSRCLYLVSRLPLLSVKRFRRNSITNGTLVRHWSHPFMSQIGLYFLQEAQLLQRNRAWRSDQMKILSLTLYIVWCVCV